jgi:hypothetical protein
VKQCQGYMLLEVIVWCALIGICGAVISGVMSWHDHTLVRNEVDTLYSTLIAHTFRACAEDCVYDVVLHERGWSTDMLAHDLNESVHFGVLPQSKGPPADPTSFVTHPVTFAQHLIRLYPDGKSRPGTVYFTDTNLSVGYALSCPVGKISYMRRYRFHAGTWVHIV